MQYKRSSIILPDDLQKNLQDIEESIAYLYNKQDIEISVLKDITLKAGRINLIEHKLQRRPQGYRVVKSDALVFLREESAQTTATYLALQSTCNCVVTLEVF